MDVLIAMLEKGNIMWQAQVDTNGTTAGFFPRFIDVRVFGKVLGVSWLTIAKWGTFNNITFELLVLHPDHFLPENTPLPIRDRATNTWTNYTVQDMELKDGSGIPLAPFPDPNSLHRGQAINPLLVTMNAQLKLSYHQTHYAYAYPPHIASKMRQVERLYELIYFAPTPTEGSRGWIKDEAIRIAAADAQDAKREAASPNPARRSPRAHSTLESGSSGGGSGGGTTHQLVDHGEVDGMEDRKDGKADYQALTTGNLARLEEIWAEEEDDEAERLLFDPETPASERMVLSSWLMSTCCVFLSCVQLELVFTDFEFSLIASSRYPRDVSVPQVTVLRFYPSPSRFNRPIIYASLQSQGRTVFLVPSELWRVCQAFARPDKVKLGLRRLSR
jgi:hypothetical protein